MDGEWDFKTSTINIDEGFRELVRPSQSIQCFTGGRSDDMIMKLQPVSRCAAASRTTRKAQWRSPVERELQ